MASFSLIGENNFDGFQVNESIIAEWEVTQQELSVYSSFTIIVSDADDNISLVYSENVGNELTGNLLIDGGIFDAGNYRIFLRGNGLFGGTDILDTNDISVKPDSYNPCPYHNYIIREINVGEVNSDVQIGRIYDCYSGSFTEDRDGATLSYSYTGDTDAIYVDNSGDVYLKADAASAMAYYRLTVTASSRWAWYWQ